MDTEELAVQKGRITRQHNYGADLLRCLAMLMIVVLHLYTQGGAMSAINRTAPKSWLRVLNYAIQWFCLGGVNLFGLLSGYLMLESRFKPRRFFGLWIQVVFVGLVLNAATLCIRPDFLKTENWILAILPVSQREYWYFTCYACVFLLSPVLNRGILALTERQATVLLIGCVFVFSLLSSLGYAYRGDPFYVVGGYSALWLIALYVMGACLKRSSNVLAGAKSARLLLIMLLCLVFDVVWHYLPLPVSLNGTKSIANKFFGLPMIVFDLCLFSLLIRTEIRSTVFRKLLCFVSPLAFSAYLITVHPVFWTAMRGSFRFVTKPSVWLSAPMLLGIGILIFTVCILADFLRDRLFRLLRVSDFCEWAETRIRRMLDKFS